MVAPLVGAWIEIDKVFVRIYQKTVAPLVGAWIEISGNSNVTSRSMSLPSWERGLKFDSILGTGHYDGRSPRGSVD